MFAEDAASAAAGITIMATGDGTATVAMIVDAGMTNGHGSTHGGWVFLLADTAFALACNSAGMPTVAARADIAFLAPTGVGDELIAEATERVRRGRSGIYDVTVRCAGEVVAEFRGTSRELPVRDPAVHDG
jgi:acyl-CoA thioesterase